MSVAPSPTPQKLDKETLIKRIKNLGPWHMNIQLTDELNTGQVFVEGGVKRGRENGGRGGDVSLLQLRDSFIEKIDAIYPDGLSEKTFLDCACNAGGYCSGLASAMSKLPSGSMFANTGSSKRDL